MPTKRRFRLLDQAAPHTEGGRMYSKGEVVESELDLVGIFPNKFQEVHDTGIKASRGVPDPGIHVAVPGRPNLVPNMRDEAETSRVRDIPQNQRMEVYQDDLGMGEDVTDEFDVDEDDNLTIHRRPDGACNVSNDGGKTKVNSRPVPKGKIKAYLEYLTSEPEDEDEDEPAPTKPKAKATPPKRETPKKGAVAKASDAKKAEEDDDDE
jgi:hypothetical protein